MEVSKYNILSLREAVAVVLINTELRRAHIKHIAKAIKQRNLYSPGDKNLSAIQELELLYHSLESDDDLLFLQIGAGYIQMRDSYYDFPLTLWESLKEFLVHETKFFAPDHVKFTLFDTQLKKKVEVEFSPAQLICIESFDKDMGKAFYIFQPNDKKVNAVKKYTLKDDTKKFQALLEEIDLLNHYLVIVAKYALVNVAYFDIAGNNVLKPSIIFPEKLCPAEIRISEGVKAKEYLKDFERTKKLYERNILLRKTALYYRMGLHKMYS